MVLALGHDRAEPGIQKHKERLLGSEIRTAPADRRRGLPSGEMDVPSGRFLPRQAGADSDCGTFLGAKPYLLTRWNTIFQPDERNEFSLTINNLLDRHDVISHGVSTYYTAPVSFLFSYAYKF